MDRLARPEQGLIEHLTAVADRTEVWASKWGAGGWGRLAGLWHDLGKFSAAFQHYIVHGGTRGSVNHTSAGAIHAVRRFEAERRKSGEWEALARVIFAHHGALSDRDRFRERLGTASAPAKASADSLYHAALKGGPPDWLLNAPLPPGARTAWRPLLVRMLFSALVDADRSDAAGAAERHHVPIPDLRARFDARVAAFGAGESPINIMRRQLLRECVGGASAPTGCFSLDAPTGFGKTLASLGFALHHAEANGLERVIYVAPFLTAMEQTAAVFRTALRDDDRSIVLEHHSTSDRDVRGKDEESIEDYTPRDLLAERLRQRENWDARVIVTSNVQFLESLYAHDAGRCRKLHRIARSVVLLDEPQSAPVSLMAPIAKALDQLARDYNTSVAFVTATLPAFKRSSAFKDGVQTMTPLVSAPLLSAMRAKADSRVSVLLPNLGDPEPWDSIADRVANGDATLCIVNTKADARALYRLLRARGVAPLLHLSAGMCAAHRGAALETIKGHLDRRDAVRIVSTQVVEAGIDLDFPRVMRAMAGLDSLIQSAGRCNRHGLRQGGTFEVFNPEGDIPVMFRDATRLTATLLRGGNGIFDPKTAGRFYSRLRDSKDTDRPRVLEALADGDYATAGRAFRLIEDTASVVVPYGEGGGQGVEKLRRAAQEERIEGLFDALQPYTVSISRGAAAKLAEAGRIEEVERFRLWIAEPGAYDDVMGLLGANDPTLSPLLTA